MPVEDINAEKMIVELFNSIEAAETTSGFWNANTALPSAVITGILILVVFLAVLVFGWFIITKALKLKK